jgi:ABC-type polysaccharide/polyol phosphate transport system ATPase subunit
MKRAEIERKFDEIVGFAEIEKFMDTPVKRYPSAWLRASSSGMYVRLAFAVAAHLEPEILLADEVLAVGDATPSSHCDTLTNGEIVVTPCLAIIWKGQANFGWTGSVMMRGDEL